MTSLGLFSMHFPAAGLSNNVTMRSQLTDVRPRHSPPTSSADSPKAHTQTCTPHDPNSLKYSVDDILQIILQSRKSWKTLKGQSEAVWPPYLEATMLKALQEYEPDDSRETRILGRYPMRNRFISDYIHTTTGKYRSAKQVGSRLQQLRDTPEGRELIEVLTRCYHTRMNAGPSNAQDHVSRPASWALSSSPSVSTISCDSSPPSSSSSPVSSTSSVMPRLPPTKSRQPVESRMPVYIDILPQQSRWLPMGYPSSTSAGSSSASDPRASPEARHIHNIDPTVTFVSPSPVNGKSSYIVLLDGAPVHSEDTPLEYVGPYCSSGSSTAQGQGEVPVLYNTALVPKYWDVLCKAVDPALYTVVQDVYRVPDPAPNRDYSQRPRPMKIFSAIYHFRYPPSAGSTSYFGQPPINASTSGLSAMTSAFNDTMFTQGTSFPMSTMYPTATSEGLAQSTTGVDQNLFDEPFMLDVSFDFDDFSINTSEGTSSSQYYSQDTYFM